MKIGRLFTSLVNQDYLESGYGFKTEIGVITAKSLLPSRLDLAVKIDYKRFFEELKLWTYYRKDFNKALYRVSQVQEDIYFQRDSSIFSRLVPLIIVNQDTKEMEAEVIKNILFTSGNLEVLFNYLLVSHLIKLYIDGEDKYIDRLKELIINFSQKDFLSDYKDYYRLDIKDKKKFKLNFELEKIKIINYLNDQELLGYEAFREVLSLVLGRDTRVETFEGKVLRSYIYGDEITSNSFYQSMGEYLEKLRASRIDPDKLEIKDYVLPDVFKYRQGESFFHSLLGKALVEKKEVEDGRVKSLVRTKTGYYLFNK